MEGTWTGFGMVPHDRKLDFIQGHATMSIFVSIFVICTFFLYYFPDR